VNFIQDSESKSVKGVLRGLHYQLPPYSQNKLVRVIEGSVLDIAVDIRKSSSTFGQHVAVELTENNKHQLFIPQGFAHGFVVLSDTATLAYKVDNYYAQDHDRGIAFDDEQLAIDWRLPKNDLQLSDKDKNHPNLSDTNDYFE
jgi:dTDP-4-dehydrorhamnose 3,5-epimerase